MSSKLLQPRAWDIQNQEMVMVTMILFASEEIDYSGNLGEPKHIDHFEIMYPTGKKDKNGVDVYEGDLIKIPRSEHFIGGVHQVHFSELGWVTSSISFNDLKTATKWDLYFPIQKGGTVIGNIYQSQTKQIR